MPYQQTEQVAFLGYSNTLLLPDLITLHLPTYYLL
jgi:hypothetical protein